jgi:hypothetical protein
VANDMITSFDFCLEHEDDEIALTITPDGASNIKRYRARSAEAANDLAESAAAYIFKLCEVLQCPLAGQLNRTRFVAALRWALNRQDQSHIQSVGGVTFLPFTFGRVVELLSRRPWKQFFPAPVRMMLLVANMSVMDRLSASLSGGAKMPAGRGSDLESRKEHLKRLQAEKKGQSAHPSALLRRLKTLSQAPENRQCVDCNADGPHIQIVVETMAFVCSACAFTHSELKHTVVPLDQTKLSRQDHAKVVSVMEHRSNKDVETYWYAHYPFETSPLPVLEDSARYKFFTEVYTKRQFAVDQGTDSRTGFTKPQANKDDGDGISLFEGITSGMASLTGDT